MANRIQLRRGGAQEWANANPTLAQGELGIELDTGRFKIGDGVTPWNSLRYERPIESTSNTANTLVQRDADGNFSAGTITATLIGNASTASRLASQRQIQLSQDIQASGTFDGSQNLTLNAVLQLITTLPHYDGTDTSSGTYTKVTVDAKGRITGGSIPTTIQDYNLNGTVEGQSAQAYNAELQSISNLGTTGFISRIGGGNVATREILGNAGRISINNGKGVNGDPSIDLINTTVVDGNYNTESLTSVSSAGPNSEPYGTETVNAVKFTVDQWGRLTSATNLPIATAREGSKYAAYSAGTSYSRYDIIETSNKVYQAIRAINAGGGAPTHTDSSDAGGWRYLAAAAIEQKGLASFAQEDFDVDNNGHVTIAALGVDNTQLQNNRISFADGNTKEDFELDQELTATTGYRGFNYLNYVKVNNINGNLLFGANNTGDNGNGEVDINVRTYFSDPDINLDGLLDQTIAKIATGDLNILSTQYDGVGRSFNIGITNSGAGSSTLNLTAEDVVNIQASDASGKVHVEDARFQSNYIATTNATLNLDPGDDRAVTGLVRIWGDLQVDGTTTTVNSTTLQVDDPIITLGGDTAPVADDNLDRGIEFRYYDTAAKLGFYGYDDSYVDLAGHVGGFAFYYDATNTSEVFSGTDAGLLAGNLKLTTNTNSTSNTTGDLVVAGGAGIGQDVNIGGLLDVDSTLRVHSTSRFDDSMVIQGASKTLQLNNGSGTTRIELQSTTGNASFYGVVDVTNNFNINTDKFNVIAASGNTSIAGTLGVTGQTTVTGATDLNSSLNVAGLVYLENTDAPTIAINGSTGFYEIQSADYGALRVDGGGYIAGDTLFNNNIYVNGLIIQKEDSTATYSRQNYLEVRYKLRAGVTAAYTPSYATHDTSNLRVYGGAGIATNLHVGDDLYVGKKNSADTIDFQVIGASGNTTIGRSGAGSASVGTLTVYGNTTLDRDLFVNGNITLGNSAVDNLVVTANTEFNAFVNIDSDFAVRTSGSVDKFTVASASGNTSIAGTLGVTGATTLSSTLGVTGATTLSSTLGVTGATTLSSTLAVTGNTTLNSNVTLVGSNTAAQELFKINNASNVTKFEVDSATGNTNIIGTLTVADPTQINDTFGASGVVTLTNNTEQTLTGLYAADGGLRVSGGVGIARNLAVGGNMRVYGDFEISGSTTQSGNTGFSGRVSITNTDDITSWTDSTISLQTAGGFKVTKNAYIGGDLYVWDAVNNRSALFVDVSTGDATLHNTLTVGGNLIVNGTTTTVNSTVTTLDDPVITLGGDTAPTSNDAKDRGVEFRYYDTSAKVGFFGLDRSSLEYVFLTAASNSSEVFTGTDGSLRAGSLRLTGTGTTLDVDANANVDGTLTVDGQIISQVASGPALVIPNTTKINNLNADLLDGFTTASTNTASTVVVRDASGNFAANILTVASGTGAGAGIQGNALTADTLKTARTITIDGVVDGSVSFNGGSNVTISTTFNDSDITALAAQTGTGLVTRTATGTYAQRTLQVTASSGITLTNADGVAGNPTINVASASTNASNNLVLRDGSGNFAANTITASLIGNVTGTVSSIANHTTTNLAEGTNLYFTDERVDDRVAALIVGGTGVSSTYNDALNTLTIAVDFTEFNTGSITEGTNLYYTNARADARVALATGANLDLSQKTTTNLAEGTNLYYTNARADARIALASVTDLSDVDQALATTDDVVFASVEADLRATGTAPTTATDPGTAGDIRYDADYVYVCVATNTWKRSPLTTW